MPAKYSGWILVNRGEKLVKILIIIINPYQLPKILLKFYFGSSGIGILSGVEDNVLINASSW